MANNSFSFLAVDLLPQAPSSSKKEVKEAVVEKNKYTKWQKAHDIWKPAYDVEYVETIKSGYYDFSISQQTGPFFKEIPIQLEGIMPLDENTNRVIDEIKKFWTLKEVFEKKSKKIKMPYKRGICLYGPPGCGKSSIISLTVKDIIERDGIALKFSNSLFLIEGVKILREVHPDKKIVVVMEEIDSLVQQQGEANLLNMGLILF